MALCDQFFSTMLNSYVHNHSNAEPALLQELRAYTAVHTDFKQMLSGPVEGALLQLLVKLLAPKRCIEIGLFTGYSALQIGAALPEQATLTCLETRRKYADIAQNFINRTHYAEKINIVLGDAKKTVLDIKGPIDFVFCDADKTAYLHYYETLLPLLAPGGLFIADNALWNGSVVAPNEKDSIALNKFNQHVHNDPRVENVLLTVRDGIMIARKK